MLYLNLRTNMSNKILDWQLNCCTQPYFNFIFCCCSLDQHREYYTKVKGSKHSDILIPHAYFTSKNRISFPVGFTSQLPSVSPALWWECNVSSFVFPVQHCQNLSWWPEKHIWLCVTSISALLAPNTPCLGTGLCAVLSGEQPTLLIPAFCLPSPGHVVQGFQWLSVL